MRNPLVGIWHLIALIKVGRYVWFVRKYRGFKVETEKLESGRNKLKRVYLQIDRRISDLKEIIVNEIKLQDHTRPRDKSVAIKL